MLLSDPVDPLARFFFEHLSAESVWWWARDSDKRSSLSDAEGSDDGWDDGGDDWCDNGEGRSSDDEGSLGACPSDCDEDGGVCPPLHNLKLSVNDPVTDHPQFVFCGRCREQSCEIAAALATAIVPLQPQSSLQ